MPWATRDPRNWAADAEKGSWTGCAPKLRLFVNLAARRGGIFDMSRWRQFLSASPPSFSACPKPTAEKKRVPGPTDNEISGDIVLYAWPLAVYASRRRNKPQLLRISTLRAALRQRHCATPIRANTCFCCRVHLGIRSLAHGASILPPRDRFAASRTVRNVSAVTGVG